MEVLEEQADGVSSPESSSAAGPAPPTSCRRSNSCHLSVNDEETLHIVTVTAQFISRASQGALAMTPTPPHTHLYCDVSSGSPLADARSSCWEPV
ncbi:hypothetical protein CesoFtcFv8_019112 [Champsocephalus esox]|uniref:Uncharacterized protein n=1 Tax=Champsocephalus esox TaxID=159716 RepID=A0AAN8BHW2_9TELE|nr:hypothetical protein CesoFtcFv8_019112 [Champsocephalus esox]